MQKCEWEVKAAGGNECLKDIYFFSLLCSEFHFLFLVPLQPRLFSLSLSSSNNSLQRRHLLLLGSPLLQLQHKHTHTHTRKYTTRANKKQVIGHRQLSEKNQPQEDNHLGPTAMLLKMSRLPFTLVRNKYKTYQITEPPNTSKNINNVVMGMPNVLGNNRFIFVAKLSVNTGTYWDLERRAQWGHFLKKIHNLLICS